MGRPRLIHLMVRIEPVMGNATYDQQHPNLVGGQAYTVQSTMDFFGGCRAAATHSATTAAAWQWRGGGGSMAAVA
jgi:hypothetical protein